MVAVSVTGAFRQTVAEEADRVMVGAACIVTLLVASSLSQPIVDLAFTL
jgi:hypothetical protein